MLQNHQISVSLASLSTPQFIVDAARLKSNCQRMLTWAAERQVKLRAHVKTHKTAQIAYTQLTGHLILEDSLSDTHRTLISSIRDGGLCCSTLSELRTMTEAGFRDILLAVPIAAHKLEAVETLCVAHPETNISLLVDHLGSIEQIISHRRTWSVWLNVDSGGHRCGTTPSDSTSNFPDASSLLMKRLFQAETEGHLLFRGLYTHAGHSYSQPDQSHIDAVSESECSILKRLVHKLDLKSKKMLDLSVGSTPTMSLAFPPLDNRFDRITEMHPGNYVYYDAMQLIFGSCLPDHISGFVLSSVISAYPSRSELLLDAGALALSKDSCPTCGHNSDGNQSKWGIIEDHPELKIVSITQELAVVRVGEGFTVECYPLGTKLKIIPNHSCLSAACFDDVAVFDRESQTVLCRWKTAPRCWV